jgi:hypothetical protein
MESPLKGQFRLARAGTTSAASRSRRQHRVDPPGAANRDPRLRAPRRVRRRPPQRASTSRSDTASTAAPVRRSRSEGRSASSASSIAWPTSGSRSRRTARTGACVPLHPDVFRAARGPAPGVHADPVAG